MAHLGLKRNWGQHLNTTLLHQKVKLQALKQWDDESVIGFNHRFEAVASCYTLGDDKVKDIYLDCLRIKLREALVIRVLETLPQAMRDTISVNVNFSKLTQATNTVSQVNQMAYISRRWPQSASPSTVTATHARSAASK